MLVDQSLVAWIFAQWVPHGFELEHWDSEAVRDIEQMIKQAKCFVEFTSPGINLGERCGALWPIKGVLRFGQQFDGALAFVDRFFFLTQGSEDRPNCPCRVASCGASRTSFSATERACSNAIRAFSLSP